jgi:propanediol dehydratase small subunit
MSMNYPLGEHQRATIRSKTGKSVDDITLENVLNGSISSEDIKISKDILNRQGAVAKENGNPQMAENLSRAAELVDIPDDLILKIYNMLRPNRSTKKELLALAEMLRNEYGAAECAKLVLDAADVYEKRAVLL